MVPILMPVSGFKNKMVFFTQKTSFKYVWDKRLKKQYMKSKRFIMKAKAFVLFLFVCIHISVSL
jgi:hypothetical protein